MPTKKPTKRTNPKSDPVAEAIRYLADTLANSLGQLSSHIDTTGFNMRTAVMDILRAQRAELDGLKLQLSHDRKVVAVRQPNDLQVVKEDDFARFCSGYMVRLTAHGAQKIQVIKVIREYTGLGLKEAKDLTDRAPSIVFDSADELRAAAMVRALRELGASAELLAPKAAQPPVTVPAPVPAPAPAAEPAPVSAHTLAAEPAPEAVSPARLPPV